AQDRGARLGEARTVVRGHGDGGRGVHPPVAVGALRPLHRALQGQRGDRTRLPAPRVLLPESRLHHRARRGRRASRGGRAHALGGVGELEEDRRQPLGIQVRTPARILIVDATPTNVRVLRAPPAGDVYVVLTARLGQ